MDERWPKEAGGHLDFYFVDLRDDAHRACGTRPRYLKKMADGHSNLKWETSTLVNLNWISNLYNQRSVFLFLFKKNYFALCGHGRLYPRDFSPFEIEILFSFNFFCVLADGVAQLTHTGGSYYLVKKDDGKSLTYWWCNLHLAGERLPPQEEWK